MCESWDGESGANAAILVDEGFDQIQPPSEGVTTLDESMLIELVDFEEASDYDAAFEQFNDTVFDEAESYIGKLGGYALWTQNDEHPNCKCGAKMDFVLELIESGGMNFGGGGEAYAFVCSECNDSARLVWQC